MGTLCFHSNCQAKPGNFKILLRKMLDAPPARLAPLAHLRRSTQVAANPPLPSRATSTAKYRMSFPMGQAPWEPFHSTQIARQSPAISRFCSAKCLTRLRRGSLRSLISDAPPRSPRIRRFPLSPRPPRNTACRPWRGRVPFAARPGLPASPSSKGPSPAGNPGRAGR